MMNKNKNVGFLTPQETQNGKTNIGLMLDELKMVVQH